MIHSQTCPICKKPLATDAKAPLFPFCSQRCREIDLYRWAEGKYAIVEPLEELPDDEEELREE